MIKVRWRLCGRMGSAVVDAVTAADDMTVVCGIDPHAAEAPFPVFARWPRRWMRRTSTCSSTSRSRTCGRQSLGSAAAGVDCVVGTTGLSNETLEGLAASATPGTCLFYAPNFTTGAVLMMEFAKAAAPYFPEAEVIEYHHCNKKDAPSGTAVRTAEIIAEARAPRVSEAPGRETDRRGCGRSRGAHRRRAGSLRALHGLCGQPGSDLRLTGSDAHHSP
ncbi:MAG: 4-hydroxy-tetrahydrodipicolinate reductase [Adlercreutzia equolifaciens]